MIRYPETVQFRAPAGANSALEALAKSEGKPATEILRETLDARLKATAVAGGLKIGAA